MSGNQIEDIDAPIELKQSKIAQGLSRVGVSKKGLGITALTGVALVALIGFGIMSAGPGAGKKDDKDSGATDMPGLSQALSVERAIADAMSKRELEVEASEEAPQVVQVRGSGQAQVVAAGPSSQQSPAEQHRAWLEKKRYERIQGRIIAGDAALTADMQKGGAGSNGGMRRVAAAGADAEGDPMARLQAARQNALNDSARMAEMRKRAAIPS